MYDQFHDVPQKVSIEPLWRIELGTGVLQADFFLKNIGLSLGNLPKKTKIPEISSVEHRQDGRHFTH